MMLPETEYGRALWVWIEQEIKAQELREPGKISNDPLLEDFRVQMGIKLGLRKVLEKPQELKQKTIKQ